MLLITFVLKILIFNQKIVFYLKIHDDVKYNQDDYGSLPFEEYK